MSNNGHKRELGIESSKTIAAVVVAIVVCAIAAGLWFSGYIPH